MEALAFYDTDSSSSSSEGSSSGSDSESDSPPQSTGTAAAAPISSAASLRLEMQRMMAGGGNDDSDDDGDDDDGDGGGPGGVPRTRNELRPQPATPLTLALSENATRSFVGLVKSVMSGEASVVGADSDVTIVVAGDAAVAASGQVWDEGSILSRTRGNAARTCGGRVRASQQPVLRRAIRGRQCGRSTAWVRRGCSRRRRRRTRDIRRTDGESVQ
ncbi:H/ACA ribonucleoprotein complex subunit [Pycnococcus provasolii]